VPGSVSSAAPPVESEPELRREFRYAGLGASGASRALVLSDGFPLNDPFGGWGVWNRVPRESVASVGSSQCRRLHLYGSDALAGSSTYFARRQIAIWFRLRPPTEMRNSPDLSLTASRAIGTVVRRLSSELFRTDGYIAVPSDLRGAVDHSG